MSTGAWLDSKHRDLIPGTAELEAIRKALDEVEDCLEQGGGSFCIAQRHPCGSYEKKTMLAGRKEADLVVVLSKAPTDTTLEDLRSLLAQGTSAKDADVLYKAVALRFPDGVKVDVLPVAMEGITSPSTSVPARLRHALSGPKHVQWFIEAAHSTPIHPVVRLLKALRSAHPALSPLRSFAIEVLAVDILRGFGGDLAAHFTKVLSALAAGFLEDRILCDPATPSNDVLDNVSVDERKRIAQTAQRVLRYAEAGTWSAVFAAASSVLPSSNLGGRTLA